MISKFQSLYKTFMNQLLIVCFLPDFSSLTHYGNNWEKLGEHERELG